MTETDTRLILIIESFKALIMKNRDYSVLKYLKWQVSRLQQTSVFHCCTAVSSAVSAVTESGGWLDSTVSPQLGQILNVCSCMHLAAVHINVLLIWSQDIFWHLSCLVLQIRIRIRDDTLIGIVFDIMFNTIHRTNCKKLTQCGSLEYCLLCSQTCRLFFQYCMLIN